MEMTYRLDEQDRPQREIEEIHELGLFPRDTWLELFRAVGLEPSIVPSEHSEQDQVIDVFVSTPASSTDG